MEKIIDTSGFYKQLNGVWFYAKYEVVSPSYTISRKRYDEIGIAENKEGWVFHDQMPIEYANFIEEQKNELKLLTDKI